MNFKQAFADVLYRLLWPYRPHTVGCCDCGSKYYLTSDLICDYWKSKSVESEEWEKDVPIVFCPYCGVKHAIIWIKLSEVDEGIKFEIY